MWMTGGEYREICQWQRSNTLRNIRNRSVLRISSVASVQFLACYPEHGFWNSCFLREINMKGQAMRIMCHWLDRYLGSCTSLLIFASSLPAWLMLILKMEAAGSSTVLVGTYPPDCMVTLSDSNNNSHYNITTPSCSTQMTTTVCVSSLLLPSNYVFCTHKWVYLARYIAHIFPLLRLVVGLVGPTHFHPDDAAHSPKTSL
jgi:hypothetical protein